MLFFGVCTLKKETQSERKPDYPDELTGLGRFGDSGGGSGEEHAMKSG